jgi:two-component system phosphate regulon response regulator PhoB
MPDLILLDVMIPKKSGFEVCRELKSDSVTRGIYIILLTAMGQERDEQEGFQCGAEDYMTKPFSPRGLRKRLHELLG